MKNIPRLLVASFAITIGIGTLLLLLPFSMRDGVPQLSLIDAFFTATSAVCVTGLAVRDTGSEFSSFGQAVILLLLQTGGLGILTFSNAILFARWRSFGLRERVLMQETVGMHAAVTPVGLLKRIFAFTVACELLGAIFLTMRFAQDFPLKHACWLGVFHSISAFCNAGFGLFSTSLTPYRTDMSINFIIMFLIICGGLGFVVVADLATFFRNIHRRGARRVSFHSRVVLITTGVLIIGGWVLFILLQYFGPAKATVSDLWLECLFLSVTARTAGFNTFDLLDLSNPALLVLILLMVVGGSPGSTAGGIKTTTLATMFALVKSRAGNRPKVELLKRSIPHDVQAKAFLSAAAYVMVVVIGVTLLELTGTRAKEHRVAAANFLPDLFEIISAVSTVGLSTGSTASYPAGGKLVLIVCMFLGRLGTLIVASSIIGSRHRVDYSYPEEKMMVG